MLDILDENYNLDEFRDLCFKLRVDYDNLGGEGKRAKARELLLLIYRQDRLAELLAQVAEDRPNVSLPDLPTLQKQAKTWRKVSTKAERIRHTLIQNVRSVWVEGVLNHSNDILLSLDLTYTPDALQRDVPILVRDDEGETAVNTSLLELFEEHGRRLLILGEPGSGKTFTLLQLTEDLLDQADRDLTHPVPVVLNLSSWALSRKPLPEWIAEEMLAQYQVARKVTKTWLEQDELLLMLDGLDEVDEVHRNECLLAINTFMAEEQAELVVCSRIGDYEQLKDNLNVSVAVQIQPLTDHEIARYLSQPGLELQPMLEADSHLFELARSPLMLTVMTLAYQGLSTEELVPLDSPEDRRQHLFGKYVEQVFKRRPVDALHNNVAWLTNLAKGMSQERQSVFYIERLQPTWLESNRWYLILFGLIFGLIGGVLLGLISAPIIGLFVGLFVGLVCGLIVGLIGGMSAALLVGLVDKIVIILSPFVKDKDKEIRIWMTIIYAAVMSGLIFGLMFGLFAGLIFGLLAGILAAVIAVYEPINTIEVLRIKRPEPRTWMVKFGQGVLIAILGCLIIALFGKEFGGMFGKQLFVASGFDSRIVNPQVEIFEKPSAWLVYGVILGLLASLTTFVQPQEIETKSQPNQGVRSSVKNAFRMLIAMGLILSGVGLLLGVLFFDSNPVIGFFTFAYVCLPPAFFYYGGTTFTKHLSLRLLLAVNRILPLKLVPFLDAMSERIILRKVGGGYIFIHRYLLEYFAGLEDSEIFQPGG